MGTGRVAPRLVALSLTVVAMALAACGGSSHPSAKPSVRATHSAVPTPTPPPSFTDKYAILKSGMTRDAVQSIMGSPGSTLSESDNGAGTTSAVVEWQDPKSSKSIIVSFVNNVMQSKSAVGF
jgi:hypothetical protein